MQLIQINGCSCSGKSTTVKGILKERGGIFHLSQDTLKWSFSDYAKEKDKYRGDVDAITLKVADYIFSRKYPVLCDSSLWREQREKLISLAKDYGYEILEINIEAEYPILQARFEQRVEDALAQQSTRISNRSLDRFKVLYEIYNAEKNSNAIVYRSDLMTPEEIISSVLVLIK